MATAFDPEKSRVSADSMAEWISGEIREDIEAVPGVGPAAKGKLAKAGVDNTYQLIGKFLMLKGTDMSVQEHCDAFLQFIIDSGISHYRHGIVLAVAEKVNTMIPGIFDVHDLDDEKK